jgi:hypothetical protein
MDDNLIISSSFLIFISLKNINSLLFQLIFYTFMIFYKIKIVINLLVILLIIISHYEQVNSNKIVALVHYSFSAVMN